MITAKRTALYVAYSTTFKQTGDNFTFILRQVAVPATYNAVQRVQVAILVLPWAGNIQPYAGGGFVIESLSNASVNRVTPSTGMQTQFVEQNSSGGFALAMVGLQLRVGKLAVFGQGASQFAGDGFVLQNGSTSLEAWVRYAFLGSRETGDVSTQQ